MDWRLIREFGGAHWLTWAFFLLLFAIGIVVPQGNPSGFLSIMLLCFLLLNPLPFAEYHSVRSCLPVSLSVFGRSCWAAFVGLPVLACLGGVLLGDLILGKSLLVRPGLPARALVLAISPLALCSGVVLLIRFRRPPFSRSFRDRVTALSSLGRLWAGLSIAFCVFFPRTNRPLDWVSAIQTGNALALGIAAYLLSVRVPLGVDGKWDLGSGVIPRNTPVRPNSLDRVGSYLSHITQPLGRKTSTTLSLILPGAAMWAIMVAGCALLVWGLQQLPLFGQENNDALFTAVVIPAAVLLAFPYRWHSSLRVLATLPVPRVSVTAFIVLGLGVAYALSAAVWILTLDLVGGLKGVTIHEIIPAGVVICAACIASLLAMVRWKPINGFLAFVIIALPAFLIIDSPLGLSLTRWTLIVILVYAFLIIAFSAIGLGATLRNCTSAYQRKHLPFGLDRFDVQNRKALRERR